MARLPRRNASQNHLQNRTLATKIFDDRILKALQYSPALPLRKETRGDVKLAARVTTLAAWAGWVGFPK